LLYSFNIEEISAQEINEIKVSSTKIRNAIKIGDFGIANKYLGHPFTITGTVKEGEKLGRTIGFPTANIQTLDFDKINPGNGVYAVKTIIDEKTHKGMMNIGVRPTVNNKEIITKEVHLFNFNENIYDKKITIEFFARIREEKKFHDIDLLKLQLVDDQKKSMQILS